MNDSRLRGAPPKPADAKPLAAPLAPGSRLGRWEVVRVLGRGGASITYLGRNPATSESRALKAVVAQHSGAESAESRHAVEEAIRALRDEAELLQTLHHPRIPRCTGFEPLENGGYIVLDYQPGESLADRLAGPQGTLDATSLHRILSEAAEGLSYLHGRGLLHRDIKPANLWLTLASGVMLLDFGAALPLAAVRRDATLFSAATPGYAAPEQYLGDGEEGPWTDLYGLGAVAYRAVCGRRPVNARARLGGEALPSAREVATGSYPEAFLAAIDEALALAPDARPRSIALWIGGLGGAVSGKAASTPPSSPQPDERPAAKDETSREEAAAPDRGMSAAGTTNHSDMLDTAARRSDEVLDDYPPTERVARVPVAAIAKTPPLHLPAAATLGSGNRRARRWGLGSLALLLLVLAGGAWGGWQGYLRYVKSEWLVDPSGAGDTITIAEAMALARSGATLHIRPGDYDESLVMSRPLHLLGLAEDDRLPRLAPAGGPCVVVTADGGSLRALAFEGSADAGPGEPCLDLGASVVVADSQVTNGAGPAARLRDAADPVLSNNRFTEVGGAAIVIEGGARGRITGNTIERSMKAGIVVRGGAEPRVSENRLIETGQAAILVTGGSTGRYENNEILGSRASGIEIRNGAQPIVIGNRIEAAEQAGVFVYDGGRGLLEGNSIVGNAFSGIVVINGGAPRIEDNEIKDNSEHGILILDGGKGRILDNRIENNSGHAVALSPGADAELGENQISGNAEPQIRDTSASEP